MTVHTTVAIDEDAVQQRLGVNIRERRGKLGLTQGALAERAGIHRTFLNQVENGRKGITTVVLVRLAAALNTSPAVLVHGLLQQNAEHRAADPAPHGT
jgi:transcriptional regulator with XRE-family HTH domain